MNCSLIYHRLTAFIFLAAFLAQTFSKTLLIADYYTNTARYAKNCENKARPKLRCNGKCQMMKKLKQEEKKDQENPERRFGGKEEIVLSVKFIFLKNTGSISIIESIKISPYSPGDIIDRSLDIFHPPRNC